MDTTRYPRITTHKNRHSSYIHTTNPNKHNTQHTHDTVGHDRDIYFENRRAFPIVNTRVHRSSAYGTPPGGARRAGAIERDDRTRRRLDDDDEMSDLNPVWKAVKPYMNGGLSGMGATCVIQPLDSASFDATRRIGSSRARVIRIRFIRRAFASGRERSRAVAIADGETHRSVERGAIVGSSERWMHATN